MCDGITYQILVTAVLFSQIDGTSVNEKDNDIATLIP